MRPPSSANIEAYTAAVSSTKIAEYVLRGLSDLPKSTESSEINEDLPVLDSHPLPTSFPLSNASWSTGIIDAATYRPDVPISWSKSIPEAAKCWSDIVTWRSSSVSWWNENYGNRTRSGPVAASTSFSTLNTTITTTIYPSSVSTYSLCDGSPRVDANPITKTITENITTSYSFMTIANATGLPDWDVPPPCEPDPNTCRLWYYHSNILELNEDELLSQCGRPTNVNESCVIRGGPIELIYWPVPPKSDLCENNLTGLPEVIAYSPNTTSKAAAPEIITTLGHTFTSGTVYLSFSTLYASWDGFWNHVGPDFSDYIVPLPSSSIFTQCGAERSARNRNHGTPLNYVDLNWPVPASAYSCQARCDPSGKPICPECPHTAVPSTGECATIWSDINPNLAMPTEIRDLVPEWSSCDMYNDRIPNFWYDPPLALTQKSEIAGVSTPYAEPTAEPPAPSSSPDSAVPVETGSSRVEAQPTGEPDKAAEKQVPEDPDTRPTEVHQDSGSENTNEPEVESPQSIAVETETQSAQDPSQDASQIQNPKPSSSASTPLPIAFSDAPLFSYDPIKSTIKSTTADRPAPTTAPLDALSVLASALSSLSTTITFTNANTNTANPLQPSNPAQSDNPTSSDDSTSSATEPSATDLSDDSTSSAITSEQPLPSVIGIPPKSSSPNSQQSQGDSENAASTQNEASSQTTSTPQQSQPPSPSPPPSTHNPPTTTSSNFAAHTPPPSNANKISYISSAPKSPERTSALTDGLPEVVVQETESAESRGGGRATGTAGTGGGSEGDEEEEGEGDVSGGSVRMGVGRCAVVVGAVVCVVVGGLGL